MYTKKIKTSVSINYCNKYTYGNKKNTGDDWHGVKKNNDSTTTGLQSETVVN
jgi:hypothetical protein